jgi:hypothetical protein
MRTTASLIGGIVVRIAEIFQQITGKKLIKIRDSVDPREAGARLR